MELIDLEDESEFYYILSEVDWKINDGPWKFDLQNNKYSFRCRFVYEYEHFDTATDTWGY